MNNKKEEKCKVGFVSIVARPNVGKSTLLNKIIGQKIAIATPSAQTTRNQIRGIYTDSDSQIIFVDTPGVHKPLNKLGEYLSEQTKTAAEQCDLIIFLVDGSEPAGRGDEWIVENILKNAKVPVLCVLNKVDLIKDMAKREAHIYSYKKLFEPKNIQILKVSAKTGRNIDNLLDNIKKYLPEGDKLYPDDEITDQNLRTIASEVIREKIILNTSDEIPHCVAVVIENYEASETIDRISAKIFVSTDSQKGILIGKSGSMLKKIGTQARLELEKIVEKKVFLELFVKVQKNWQKDEKAMKILGLE